MIRARPMTRAERAARADALHDMIRDGVSLRSLALGGMVVGPRKAARLIRMARISAADLRRPS